MNSFNNSIIFNQPNPFGKSDIPEQEFSINVLEGSGTILMVQSQ